jgi:putative hydrolase
MSSWSILEGDFHVHSTYSDDARDSLEANVEAASAAGLAQIRFSDHVRADTTWVPEYLAAVAALRQPDGLTLSCAVETKINDASGALDLPAGLRVGTGGLDAVLIADHRFPGPDGAWTPEETRHRLATGLRVADALDLLIAALAAAMRSVDGGQLAHCFSILPKIGLSEDDLTHEHLATWASEAAESETAVEINEKWNCPGPRAVRAALDAGVRLVASTDSHRADDVGRYVNVKRILAEAMA